MNIVYQNNALAGKDMSVDRLRAEIVDRVKLHTEMISRLLMEPAQLPHDFSAFLEDIANAYLDIADEVSLWATADRPRPN